MKLRLISQNGIYNKRLISECIILMLLLSLLYIFGILNSISPEDSARTAMSIYAFAFDEYYINNGHIPNHDSINDIKNNFLMNKNRFIEESNIVFSLHNNAIKMSCQFSRNKKMKAIWAYKSLGESITFIEN